MSYNGPRVRAQEALAGTLAGRGVSPHRWQVLPPQPRKDPKVVAGWSGPAPASPAKDRQVTPMLIL